MAKRRSVKGTPAAAWFAASSFNGRRREEAPTEKVQVLELQPRVAPVVDVQGSDPILPPSPPAEFSDEFLDSVEESTLPGWPRGAA